MQVRAQSTPMTTAISIRRARPEEADHLSGIAMRAKAYWGYDDTFMEACRDELSVRADEIEAGRVWLGERDGVPLGFIDVRIEDGVAELYACFVDPEVIGSGLGRVLWTKVEDLARTAGVDTVGLDSDPYAEGFYLAMGAQRVGEAPSGSIAGRMLPRLIKKIS